MKKLIFKNMANLVVFIRTALIFLVIYLLSINSFVFRLTGFMLLFVVALLDWADGYIARSCNIASNLGGLLDTLGDRITENLLLIFFAYAQIIPLFVPLIFVARSFLSDFIRYQSFCDGIGTFAIHKSKLGLLFVASKPSRLLYLVSKMAIFSLASLILIIETTTNSNLDLAMLSANLRLVVFYVSIYVVLFSIFRFALLIYDSRFILRERFYN